MSRTADAQRPIRIWMADLLAIVPYYTGHLCASLRNSADICVSLASITYQYDREFFRGAGIRNDPGVLDLSSRLGRMPAVVRRMFKIVEYLVNMAAVLIRAAIARPDVLHVQFLPLIEYGVSLERWWMRILKAMGIPVVYTVHNVLPQDRGIRLRAAYRRIYQMADRLICHDNDAARRLMEEFGVRPGRISVIPHGPLFETAKPRPSREGRLPVAPNQVLVLCQGILRPYKGVSFLLKAWQRVHAGNAPACLWIAGTGEPRQLKQLEEETRELGIESSVHLEFRFLPVPEMAALYDAADVLVYPYAEVTTSGALMTGVMRGKAIIATTLPAFQEVLTDEEDALLVPYGDVQRLADALLRLIGSAELRRQLGTKLRNASIPQWSEIARLTSECYREVCSGERRLTEVLSA